jgi:hypothetical protein
VKIHTISCSEIIQYIYGRGQMTIKYFEKKMIKSGRNTMALLDRVTRLNGVALALHVTNHHDSCRIKFLEALSVLIKLEQERSSSNLEDGENYVARPIVEEKASEDVSTCSAGIPSAVQTLISVAEFDATLVKDEALLVNLYRVSIIYNLSLVHCEVGNLIEAEQLLHLSSVLAANENENGLCSIGYDGGDNTYGVQVLIKIFHLLGCVCIHREAHCSNLSQCGFFPPSNLQWNDQDTRFFKGLTFLVEAFSLANEHLGCFHQYTCEIRTVIGNALIQAGMQEDALIMFDQSLWTLIQAAIQDDVHLHERDNSAAAA